MDYVIEILAVYYIEHIQHIIYYVVEIREKESGNQYSYEVYNEKELTEYLDFYISYNEEHNSFHYYKLNFEQRGQRIFIDNTVKHISLPSKLNLKTDMIFELLSEDIIYSIYQSKERMDSDEITQTYCDKIYGKGSYLGEFSFAEASEEEIKTQLKNAMVSQYNRYIVDNRGYLKDEDILKLMASERKERYAYYCVDTQLGKQRLLCVTRITLPEV